MARGKSPAFPRALPRRLVPPGLLLAVLVLTCSSGCGVLQPGLTPAERGRRLAERSGCFACHGPEGREGIPNPGRADRTVPNFTDDVMMFAKDEEAVREWIRDGMTVAKARSATWREQRAKGALRMPAFEHRLNSRQIQDLVAFVQASAGRPQPADSLAQAGLRRAQALGCAGCHGPGGRFGRPNPGSLRGYVPSWDGRDFPDLVRSRAEFGEWVERGLSRRFERNALARFFIGRATVKMPAFERHLEPSDVDALWAYVLWFRSQSPEQDASPPPRAAR
jgi:mono/diheme cytochrome c family protein